MPKSESGGVARIGAGFDAKAKRHAALAYVATEYGRDWKLPISISAARSELNPSNATAHHSYSIYLMATGHHAITRRDRLLLAGWIRPRSSFGLRWRSAFSARDYTMR